MDVEIMTLSEERKSFNSCKDAQGGGGGVWRCSMLLSSEESIHIELGILGTTLTWTIDMLELNVILLKKAAGEFCANYHLPSVKMCMKSTYFDQNKGFFKMKQARCQNFACLHFLCREAVTYSTRIKIIEAGLTSDFYPLLSR